MKPLPSEAVAADISQFDIEGELEDLRVLDRGHIHNTFISTWRAGSLTQRFLHQQLNDKVFTDIPALMHNVKTVTRYLKKAAREGGGQEALQTLELVRTRRGVQWINDSIATAPERALAALNAFGEPIILLAGGRDKAMEWEAWAKTVTRRVKTVILFGALADMLAEKLAEQHHPDYHKVDTVAEAVEMAAETAVSGDIVLLSPGGTSYDAFNDFEERGELFRQLVNEL